MSRSIEPPPLLKYSFRNFKRRGYSGSSSRLVDPDVVEIPPPIHNPSKLMKQKEAILHDVIDIDNDNDSADVVLIGEKFAKSNKGKTIEAVHDHHGVHQDVKVSDYPFGHSGAEKLGPASGIDSSNDFPSISNNLINVDDLSYDDDDYADIFSEDYMDVDEYALLQAHFDNVDIPPGIEAPIPWLPEYDLGLKKTGSSSFNPSYHAQSDAKISSWLLEPTKPKIQGSSVGSSGLHINNFDKPSGIELSCPQLSSHAASSKKISATAQCRGRESNLLLGVDSTKSQWFSGPCQINKKHAIFGASNNHGHGFVNSPEAMKLPPTGAPFWGQFNSAKKAAGSSSSYHSNFMTPVDGSFNPLGIESDNPWLKSSINFKPLFTNHTANSTYNSSFPPPHTPPHLFNNTWVHNSAGYGKNGSSADSPVMEISDEARDEILRKFQSFKQFDTVEDSSDHYFIGYNSSTKQPLKNWAKRIQDEWKILEKDLPDSIFVRVYESRMDLLRAVIIGAEGTPYHDGLFFFDVFFPSGYPNVPPQVHYHSGGLRLNPNLYNCGKVCLSLLNTWAGNQKEMWLPGVSTILQVLVSIQGLILNTKPYFNEPGYAHMSGSAHGEMRSLQYNEDTFILSLRTMMYMMRKPPKNFEDFVAGHFCSRAHDILVACKSYMEGAQVGCLVKGGVQDVDEGDKSCSKKFKESLAGYVTMLVKEFTQIGAKGCEKLLPPATLVNKPLGSLPRAAT